MIGIRGFFLDEINQFSAKSIDITKIVVINRQNFLECLKKFPDDYEKFCYFRD